MEKCTFIPVSEIGLSDQGMVDISESSRITFGDANRTLYTFDRLIDHVNFDNESDITLIKKAQEDYGLETEYVDLEN
tara:strand:- start:2262 stop:2492 length:231 start_codon:yes stop_codon:yes gene_type:complete